MLYVRNIYTNIPIVKICIVFIIGILCSIYFSSPIFLFAASLLISLATVWSYFLIKNSTLTNLNYAHKKVLLLIYISFLSLGYTNGFLYHSKNHTNHFSQITSKNKSLLKIKLLETPIEKENSFKAVSQVISIYDSNKIIKTSGNIICYFKKDSNVLNLVDGDILYINSITNAIDRVRNPNEFDYRRYLSYKNISHQIYLTETDWHIALKNRNIITLFLHKTKTKLQQIIDKNIHGSDERAVASALLLGNRNFLTDDILASFSSTGATHILAVSGLHVGIFYGIVSFSLAWLKRFKKLKILHPILTIAFIWFYVLLTGGSPSVIRAATMFSLFAIGFHINKNINIYNIIAFSALIISAINPYIITEVGFQLSYLAVIGIIYLQDKIYKSIYVKYYLLDKIWIITSVSIAAQISTFPLMILYFHQFPNLFFISNIIVIPAASIILYGGILIFVFSWNESILYILGEILSFIILSLNKSLGMIEQIPYALTTKLYISHLQAIFFYILVLLFIFMIEKRNKVLLNYFLIISFLFSLTFAFNFYKTQSKSTLTVYHVPKFSAIEIMHGNNSYLLFDSIFLNDKNLINFRVEHNWWQNQIKNQLFEIEHLNETQISSNKCFSIQNKKILLIKPDYIIPNQVTEVDFVIISHNPKLYLDKFSEKVKAKTYIFDTSNKSKNEKYWKQDCEKLGINCYFVSDSTAYQINLKQ